MQGYHQIPLKPSFRPFCCFEWQGRVYRWNVLPFGISTAPRTYSKLSRLMLAQWRKDGIRCSNYIDDFIFFARSREEAEGLRDRVLADMERLGWYVNIPKSQLAPAQRVTYLGYELCSTPHPFLQVPAQKVRACREKIRYMLGRRDSLGTSVSFEGRTVAAVAGSECRHFCDVLHWNLFLLGIARAAAWHGGGCLALLVPDRRHNSLPPLFLSRPSGCFSLIVACSFAVF